MEPRLEFVREHPLLELTAFYDRANKITVALTDPKTGKSAQTDFVVAPSRLLDYVKGGEPYGVSVADMIFVSDRTPEKFIPLVVFKLFMERFVDPGLDETGRAKHLKAAFDAIRLAPFAGLSLSEMAEFINILIAHDPSGVIKADPIVQKYLGIPPWRVPERAKYLEAHHAHWRVRHSREFAALLSTFNCERMFRDFHVSKADLVLFNATHANPYLLGAFIRRASTIPLGMPFVVDEAMSAPAYALTEGECGVDLIRFIEGRPDRTNVVIRYGGEFATERTWTALVTRVETGLLLLERRIDERVAQLQGRVKAVTDQIEKARKDIAAAKEQLATVYHIPQDFAARFAHLGESSRALIGNAAKSLVALGEELSTAEQLKAAIGAK
ncbi:MAG: hypothetical protein AB1657_05685 [Candidatus Micrarchaeota archaeon]